MRRFGAGPRLLDELRDAAVVIDRHHTIRRRVVDRREGDRRRASTFFVIRDEFGEVEVGEHITVQDDDAFGRHPREVRGVSDRARGVERSRLGRVEKLDALPTRFGEGLQKWIRTVPEGEHGAGDVVERKPFDHPRDDRAADDRQHRLWDVVGERAKSGPFSTNEHHRLHEPAPRPFLFVLRLA